MTIDYFGVMIDELHRILYIIRIIYEKHFYWAIYLQFDFALVEVKNDLLKRWKSNNHYLSKFTFF